MSQIRMHIKDSVHFVTNRCEHEMFLMMPTPAVTKIIQSWFAKALCRFGDGLEIYAFIFLSNHFHILCRDTKGTLAAFMWYFQGNVAKAINKELGRKGRFWSREYDDVLVPSDEDFWNRYTYTVGNAVKSGLVNTSREWPGWSSLEGALSDGKYRFEMLNQTRYHNARRRGQKVDKSKFVEVWTFQLAVPPKLKEKSSAEQRAYIKEALDNAEATFHKDRGYKPVLGVKNIMRQQPLDRPFSPSFRPRIKIFCRNDAERGEQLDGYRKFVDGYLKIFDGFKNSISVKDPQKLEWPVGSFPPSSLYPIGYEP
jgi:putative transposase